MRNNKETLNEAYKEIAKLKKMMAQTDVMIKEMRYEQVSIGKNIENLIIKIVRDIITLSFINKLYGRK